MEAQALAVDRPQPLLPEVFDDLSQLPGLPRDLMRWPLDAAHSGTCAKAARASLSAAAGHGQWIWPQSPVVFISDPHADAEGFLRSLVAAGVVRRRDDSPTGFALTGFGRTARIVIGGDCLDKGPSNLAMLDALAAFYATGARIELLAGNHDLRLMLAITALNQPRSVLTEHLFVRMGRKILPLLREVLDRDADTLAPLPDAATCRARLLPRADWAARFAHAAHPYLSPAAITKELRRMAEKGADFEADAARHGLTMQQVYAAAQICHRLFLTPGGRYAWFFERMQLIQQMGSVLFVHAGLDDAMAAELRRDGPAGINAGLAQAAARDPFAFYFGPMANLTRTKYRQTDKALTDAGVSDLLASGIKLVVQGHVNRHEGQRLLAKRGVLHLEADVTLDRHSRAREGLSGIGHGATLIYPSGDIVGLSSDFPRAKHFRPDHYDPDHA